MKSKLRVSFGFFVATLAVWCHAQAPGSPPVDKMSGWMAGTTMCLIIQGANSDKTSPAKLPQGSGFLVSEFGYLLTNSHVVRPQTIENGGYGIFVPTQIRGTFDSDCDLNSGPSYVLEIVAFDSYADLALLKIRQNADGARGGWRYIPRSNSNLLVKSQKLLAVGFPKGSSRIDQVGQISALDRSQGRYETDLPLNRGYSGGPVLDLRGYVVGVVWGGREDQGGVNLFIPINHAANLISLAGEK